MNRRTFAQLLSLTFLPIPGVEAAAPKSGVVKILTEGSVYMTFPLDFVPNTTMVATFLFSEKVKIDTVVLETAELPETLCKEIGPFYAQPADTLTVKWVVNVF